MPNVILTSEAIEDLFNIYKYIQEQSDEERAEAILHRLEKAAHSLDKLALRGKFPEELSSFGNKKIREIQVPPWRIFYRVEEKNIFILNVLDGRRAIEEILRTR